MNKHIIALGLFVCIAATAFAQDAKTTTEKVLGEKRMPDITLTDIHGKAVNVSELYKEGKIVVFSFWATWCVPCKKELNNIAELYEEWQKKYNVQIVAVSIDDSRNATKVKPYIEGQRWDYKVLLDQNSDLKRALNIQSVPFTVVVDASGKIVNTHSGYVDGDEFVLEEELQKLAAKKPGQ